MDKGHFRVLPGKASLTYLLVWFTPLGLGWIPEFPKGQDGGWDQNGRCHVMFNPCQCENMAFSLYSVFLSSYIVGLYQLNIFVLFLRYGLLTEEIKESKCLTKGLGSGWERGIIVSPKKALPHSGNGFFLLWNEILVRLCFSPSRTSWYSKIVVTHLKQEKMERNGKFHIWYFLIPDKVETNSVFSNQEKRCMFIFITEIHLRFFFGKF